MTNAQSSIIIGYAGDFAYSEQLGWIDFDPDFATTTVYEDHLEGYAYGEQAGWISLSCENDGSCGDVDYGVSYSSTTNELSGYAYGEQAGWISFSCENDGSCGDVDYGVSIDGNAFKGYAYGEQIGWVSFNCINDGSCGIIDYKVFANINTPPTVSDMTAPNITLPNACGGAALRAKLDWKFNDVDAGDSLQSYRLWVKKADDALVFDSGDCNAASSSCSDCVGWTSGQTCSFTLSASHGLAYDTAYKWEVEAIDSEGGSSGVVPYNSPTDTPSIPEVEDGAAATFTTYKSEFPDPDNFTWLPRDFNAGEDVLFDSGDKALYYTGDTSNPCNEAHCSWNWIDFNNNIDPEPTDASTTIINFTAPSPSSVRLEITDIDTGYTCGSTTEAFIIKQKLPSWIETKK